MDNITENTLKVTEYTVLGKLPPLLISDSGEQINTPEKWRLRREEIKKTVIDLQYGTIPPAPEFLDVETLYRGRVSSTYKIITGTRARPVTFRMKITLPENASRRPVIVCGDLCFDYAMDKEYLSAALDRGIGWVFFDRTELAHDIMGEGRSHGALYETYPDHTFGALGAWAWGYSRCVDALEKLALPGIDLGCIAFSGHSRGGKTAALAGALDERAAVVNPNETCAGSCGCYRVHMKAIDPDGAEKRSETLTDLWNNFGYWLGPEMEKYVGHEEDLPFDAHFLKALIAPRTLFVSEAAGDIWSNPVGSWQTTMAAKEVFRLLGAKDELLWYFREGKHYHTSGDVRMLASVIAHKHDGAPLCDGFSVLPFSPFPPIY